MTTYLVDTDVLSEPRKAKPNAGVVAWLRVHETAVYTSAVVIGEIAWGIDRLPSGTKRRDLTDWLQNRVLAAMTGRVLRFDTRVALEWGKLQATLESHGKRMPWRDSVIAATARRHGLIVATRNDKDFAQAAVRVVNPFKGA